MDRFELGERNYEFLDAIRSKMKKILIVQGGWEGHEPAVFSKMLAAELQKHGMQPRIESSLDCLNYLEELQTFALIVPFWTMGTLSETQSQALQAAVKSGVGLGGMHGGAGDAFRGNLDYEWMVGGHFVGHPHVGEYEVRITDAKHSITRELPPSFPYRSEQYYLMMDPGVHVLADCEYLYENRRVTMPVAWTKTWGGGKVFYSSLGHAPGEFSEFPAALELTLRGLRWAAGAL